MGGGAARLALGCWGGDIAKKKKKKKKSAVFCPGWSGMAEETGAYRTTQDQVEVTELAGGAAASSCSSVGAASPESSGSKAFGKEISSSPSSPGPGFRNTGPVKIWNPDFPLSIVHIFIGRRSGGSNSIVSKACALMLIVPPPRSLLSLYTDGTMQQRQSKGRSKKKGGGGWKEVEWKRGGGARESEGEGAEYLV